MVLKKQLRRFGVATWRGTPFYTGRRRKCTGCGKPFRAPEMVTIDRDGRLMVHASNRWNPSGPIRDCATAHFVGKRRTSPTIHNLAIYIGPGWRETDRRSAKTWKVGSRRVRNVEFVTFEAAA